MKSSLSRRAVVLVSLLALCSSTISEAASNSQEVNAVNGPSFLETAVKITKTEEEELLAAENAVTSALSGDDQDDEVSTSTFRKVDHEKDPALDPLFLAQGNKPQVVEWLTINEETPIEMANVIISRKNIEVAKNDAKISQERALSEKAMQAKEAALQKYAADRTLVESAEKNVVDAKHQVSNIKSDIAKYSEILARRQAALAKAKRDKANHERELITLKSAADEASTNYKVIQKLHSILVEDERKLKEAALQLELDIKSGVGERNKEFSAFKIAILQDMEPKIKNKEEEIAAVVDRLRSNIENVAKAILSQQQDIANDEDAALKVGLTSFKNTVFKLEADYLTQMQSLSDMMTMTLTVRQNDLEKFPTLDASKIISVVNESNMRFQSLREQARMKTENVNILKSQALDAYLARKNKIMVSFNEQMLKMKAFANSRVEERMKQIMEADGQLQAYINEVGLEADARIAEAEQRMLKGSEDQQSQLAEAQGKAVAATKGVDEHVEPTNKAYKLFLDAQRAYSEAALIQFDALIKVRENEVMEAKTKLEESVEREKESEFDSRRIEKRESEVADIVDRDMALIRRYDSVSKDHTATAESLEHINIPKIVEKQVREEWKLLDSQKEETARLHAEAVKAALEASDSASENGRAEHAILENTAVGVETLSEEYAVTVNETPEGPVVVMSTEDGPVVIDAEPQGPVITEETMQGPVVIEELVYGAQVIAAPVLAAQDTIQHAVQQALHDMPAPEYMAEAKADLVFQANHNHGATEGVPPPPKIEYEKFFVRSGLENTADTMLRPWHKQVQYEADWEKAHPIHVKV